MTETGIHLPHGVEIQDVPTVGPVGPGRVVIDNRTDLPDEQVEGAVQDYFVENASMAWGHNGTFQTYATNGGSLMARTKFSTPTNVFDEIKLARDLAERDDDIRSAIGAIIAVAYQNGMQNFHEDERTVSFFNEIAREADLDHRLKEMLREYLVAGSVTTVTAFTRSRVSFNPVGTEDRVEERLATPIIGILPAEQIRVIGNDLFGQGGLGYLPIDDKHRKWLEEFFEEKTTAARKNAMRAEDPISAALFTERVRWEDERQIMTGVTTWVYRLNPRMAARKCMPKGPGQSYPRPLLTANFALVEAKRLLNIMDFALLQGGANFIVVAKKGTDQHRASEVELRNLGEVVRKASRTGVIVGDHRLSFEIITPKLDELLNEQKRRLIGSKMASLLLRVPELAPNAGVEGQKTWVELVQAVITSDRHDIQRHVEATAYAEAAQRNSRVFKKGAAKIWHQKIILQGAQFFNDMVLKLADRGNISRKTLTEVAGFSWEAEVAQRQHEIESGHDDIMVPAAVPHDSPQNQMPGDDGGEGRPQGAGDGSRPDPRAPRRPRRGQGETVKAWWDESLEETVRVGEVTYRLLEQYPDYEEGRITGFERDALRSGEVASEGPVTVMPVNQGHECTALRMIRLAPGLGAVIGYRKGDDAIVAKALTFRAPEFDEVAAEELLLGLGYDRPEIEPPEED